jgi:hypothetical protein
MSEGFDFLGFRIQWRRKRGTDKWHVSTFIADRPIRHLKGKIRALTNRMAAHSASVMRIPANSIGMIGRIAAHVREADPHVPRSVEIRLLSPQEGSGSVNSHSRSTEENLFFITT